MSGRRGLAAAKGELILSRLDRSLIAGLPAFEGISPDGLDKILARAVALRVAKDAAVFEQGGEAKSFYILLDGRVRVVKMTPDGRQVIVRYISAGELLGIAHALGRARTLVAQGSPVSEAFATLEIFPTFVVRMLRIGEMTGQLDASLRNVSYFFTRDVDERLDSLQSMIEPALTLVMGAVLGWVMVAVLGPVYDTITQFGS